MERITLKQGDVFRETIKAVDTGEPIEFLARVSFVGEDQRGEDYMAADYAIDKAGVHSSTKLYLSEGERKGKKAIIPKRFNANGIETEVEKVKAPKDTKWSYDF